MTETGSLAGECRYGNLRLWADRDEGSGQLVVTPLTMLVVMALTATVMTGPILARLRSRAGSRLEQLDDVAGRVLD